MLSVDLGDPNSIDLWYRLDWVGRRPNSKQAMTQDGGLLALAGFVNQMLGSAEDLVQCISGGDPFETLISFETEAAGQDNVMTGLAASGKRIRQLTQYKFSQSPTLHPIRPSELKEIAAGLRKSETKCNKSLRLPTRRILRSNRPLSPLASRSPLLAEIEFLQYDPDQALKTLSAYASRFGVLGRDELSRGVQLVIGRLFQTAASPGAHYLTREAFDEALTGCGHPRSIAIDDAGTWLQEDLNGQKEYRLGLEGSYLIERDIVKNAMADWINDALIVFTGEGGLGKTTALWQVLRAGVDKTASPRRLAALITAGTGMPKSFGELVDQWRGSESATKDDSLALRRLQCANGDVQRPILLLGLDGADETHSSNAFREAAARIMDFFWTLHQQYKESLEPPPARLLVSCRRPEEVEKFIQTVTGRGVSGKPPKYVRFEEFTVAEIWMLLQRPDIASPDAVQRLVRAAELNPDQAYATTAPAYDRQAVMSLSLLRHPILWSCFMALTPPQQSAFVSGNAQAQDALAARYLEWFMRRASQRLGFLPSDMKPALAAAAQKSSAGETSHKVDLWTVAVREAAGYSMAEARRLYHEGVSAGLIEELPPAGGLPARSQSLWRWRHAFLWSHLRNGE